MDDCANGARYLANRGEVDGKRLVITRRQRRRLHDALCVDLSQDVQSRSEPLRRQRRRSPGARHTQIRVAVPTGLLGPYPERRDIYYERSPINFPERLSCPVIFFQGLEDKVVPPDQAEKMVEAMRSKGLPVAYVAFPGEQHGFRQAKNIKRALDGELYFYSRVFRFALADPVEPVAIENL